MNYVLIVRNMDLARGDAEPFIPDNFLLKGLYGIRVFGPYDSQREASKALRSFPLVEDWQLSVLPLNSLSEDLDNPYAALMMGDSPEWTL